MLPIYVSPKECSNTLLYPLSPLTQVPVAFSVVEQQILSIPGNLDENPLQLLQTKYMYDNCIPGHLLPFFHLISPQP